MNDEKLAELREKYKNRNLREELSWGAYANHNGYTGKTNAEFLNWLCNAAYRRIKELEETKWIPVKERLPEENVKVLTQDNEGNIQVDWLLHLELRWFYSQHHIVAWQPLQKPYKEESEE